MFDKTAFRLPHEKKNWDRKDNGKADEIFKMWGKTEKYFEIIIHKKSSDL